MADLIKKTCWLLVMVLMAGCGSKYLLKPEEVPEWQVTRAVSYTKTAELKQILGESFQLYRGYQIKRLTRQELTSSDFRQILVELFEMGGEMNARSIYRRYQTFNTSTIGTEASVGPGFVVFYRGPYFVRLTGKRNLLGKEEQLVRIANLIDTKLSKE